MTLQALTLSEHSITYQPQICIDFFLSGGCEDRDILLAFFTNLTIEYIYLSPELREKWPYL